MKASDNLRRIPAEQLSRSLTPHLDVTRIANNDFRVKMSPRAALPGKDGAHARMLLAILPAANEALAKELDAGLPESAVSILLANSLASVIASHLMRFTYSEPPERRLGLLEMYGSRILAMTADLLRDADNLPPDQVAGIITPAIKKGGNA